MISKQKIDKHAWRWFYRQLPELTQKKVITAEAAAALTDYYGVPPKKTDAINIVIVAFGILAALLIGGGAIMILAHNWDDLPRSVRLILAFTPLIITQIAGACALWRKPSTVGRECCPVLISLCVCAAISIVAQIYQISGDTARFLLTWALLTLPLIYLFRSSATAILYLVLTVCWGYAAKQQHLDLWPFWLLFAAALPHIYRVVKADRWSLRSIWLLWAIGLAIVCMLGGIIDTYRYSRIWVMAYGILFSGFYLAGRQYFNEENSMWCKPLSFLGTMGLIGTTVICSYGAFWRFPSYWRYENDLPQVWIPDLVVAVLFISVYVVLLSRTIRRRDFPALLPGGMAILATASWLLYIYSENRTAPALLCNLYLVLAGCNFIVSGIRKKQLLSLNGGLLIIGGTVILRFFDSDFDLIARGIAFIIIGLAFLAVNLRVRRRWRQENPDMEAVNHE